MRIGLVQSANCWGWEDGRKKIALKAIAVTSGGTCLSGKGTFNIFPTILFIKQNHPMLSASPYGLESLNSNTFGIYLTCLG